MKLLFFCCLSVRGSFITTLLCVRSRWLHSPQHEPDLISPPAAGQHGEPRSDQSGRFAGSEAPGFTELCSLSVSRLHEGNWEFCTWCCRPVCPSDGFAEEASLSSSVEPAHFNSCIISGQLFSDSLGNTEVLRPLDAAGKRPSP